MRVQFSKCQISPVEDFPLYSARFYNCLKQGCVTQKSHQIFAFYLERLRGSRLMPDILCDFIRFTVLLQKIEVIDGK